MQRSTIVPIINIESDKVMRFNNLNFSKNKNSKAKDNYSGDIIKTYYITPSKKFFNKNKIFNSEKDEEDNIIKLSENYLNNKSELKNFILESNNNLDLNISNTLEKAKILPDTSINYLPRYKTYRFEKNSSKLSEEFNYNMQQKSKSEFINQ